ncbi:hypothetical protein D3C80_1676510 [compost metagenome]
MRGQPERLAGFQHAVVQVDTNGGKPLAYHQFQPLTTATAKIKYRVISVQSLERFEERQIGLQPLGDRLPRTAITVLESPVKTCTH